jgi:hypothetical protein
VSHDLHETLLLTLSFSLFRWSLNTFINFFNELLDVSHLLKSVLVEEVSVSVNPLVDSHLEFSDQWVDIDSQPATVD